MHNNEGKGPKPLHCSYNNSVHSWKCLANTKAHLPLLPPYLLKKLKIREWGSFGTLTLSGLYL